ncbi:CAF17-like 4Fe-4S cluster assembly/insertion protein YgfZ [Sulfitobacter donghicola]|uniref:Aminomethyltransferase n=1 Tax=Sulfitobacter donghicola DSW-25 = KCTC 12864 = JCM 14565 TaxID=1300350 RepID=A0A073II10_9RHOB|nr:folate-binding protein YgfZ [Sulfitobacter donghicola]KEJ89200.1 aminomethyltransferase [Sulfitobacter donghicola DSW-25 = KCTC 12864 = JCM 14565]KIN68990.1 Aminomethyl transferase family protein [Sulfitobacter donghicola DSW-25 = KCTC 12864 = JCM 14565]
MPPISRQILRFTGSDTREFLQGLITNDIQGLESGLVYAAILTPQGKYLADFFLKADAEAVLLDVDASLSDMLLQRLNMYKLRADVKIEASDLHLHRGTGPAPDDALPDPRHSALGWRAYRDTPQTEDTTDWPALYVEHAIPSTNSELTSDSFILEMGFERIHGVDFRKGCYVGQEVTARMKHKTELRKGLARVEVSGDAPSGTAITVQGKAAGTLLTRSGNNALAYLRFDRATGAMDADGSVVKRID